MFVTIFLQKFIKIRNQTEPKKSSGSKIKTLTVLETNSFFGVNRFHIASFIMTFTSVVSSTASSSISLWCMALASGLRICMLPGKSVCWDITQWPAVCYNTKKVWDQRRQWASPSSLQITQPVPESLVSLGLFHCVGLTPALKHIHHLPIKHCIRYKLCLLYVLMCLWHTNTAPQYLTNSISVWITDSDFTHTKSLSVCDWVVS